MWNALIARTIQCGLTPAIAIVLPPPPRVAHVSTDLVEFAEAVTLLTQYRPEKPSTPLELLAAQWIDRALQRLAQRIERYLCPQPRINTEQQALAYIKTIGHELKHAGEALLTAAQQFKNIQGQGVKASQTYMAAQRALNAAEELIGT